MQRRQLLYFIIDFDQISWIWRIYFNVTCQVMKLSEVLDDVLFCFKENIFIKSVIMGFMYLNNNLSIGLLFKRVDIFQPL